MKNWIRDILLVGAGFAGSIRSLLMLRSKMSASITRKKSSTLTNRSKLKLRSKQLT